MQTKLISAIIPVYNAEKYISQAIESVLAQTYRPIEIVVADDGSTDGTAAMVQRYPDVRYVYQRNQGPPAARNAGLANSTGELIAYLDADDYWPSHKLAEQSEYLEAHLELGCVMGQWLNFLEEGIERPDWIPEAALQEDVISLGLGTSLIHRWMFDRVGNFNLRYWFADDVEWFYRVREAGIPIGFTSSVMAYRRIHSTNISEDQAAVAKATLHILKEHLDRKRGESLGSLSGAHL